MPQLTGSGESVCETDRSACGSENVSCSENVFEAPASSEKSQLRPAPLSTTSVHWQVSGKLSPPATSYQNWGHADSS